MAAEVLPLARYQQRSDWHKFSQGANEVFKKFDGFYRLSKVVGKLAEMVAEATKHVFSESHSLFKAMGPLVTDCAIIKRVHDGLMILGLIHEWTTKGFTGNWAEVACRVALTVGAVLKLALYLDKIVSLGRIVTSTIGKIPILGTLTDSIFCVYFACSVAKNSLKIRESARKMEVFGTRLQEWQNGGRENSFNVGYQEGKWYIAEGAGLRAKAQRILYKIDLVNNPDPNRMENFLRYSTEKYEAKLLNARKDRISSIVGLCSDALKVVLILTSIIAIAIFGWAGLAAFATMAALSLAADSLGLTKFFLDITRVAEPRHPAIPVI